MMTYPSPHASSIIKSKHTVGLCVGVSVVGLAVTDGACDAVGTGVGGTETVGDDVGQEVPEASAPFSSHISVGPYGAVPLKNVPPNVQ